MTQLLVFATFTFFSIIPKFCNCSSVKGYVNQGSFHWESLFAFFQLPIFTWKSKGLFELSYSRFPIWILVFWKPGPEFTFITSLNLQICVHILIWVNTKIVRKLFYLLPQVMCLLLTYIPDKTDYSKGRTVLKGGQFEPLLLHILGRRFNMTLQNC